MISEGSWDTKDWSNDAEYTAFHQEYLKIYSNGYCFYCIFDQINAALVIIRYFI